MASRHTRLTKRQFLTVAPKNLPKKIKDLPLRTFRKLFDDERIVKPDTARVVPDR